MRRLYSIFAAILLLLPLGALGADPFIVRFSTNLGNIDVKMRPDVAPLTVANFMSYVNSGAYNQSLIHRSIPGFVIQGGGYYLSGNTLNNVQAMPAVTSEAQLPNTRGTLAMALSTGPNSGTCQWYFNLIDNSSLLDGTTDGGPFTVFGQVNDPASLAVMDQIGAEPTYDLSSSFGAPFTNLPLINYNPANGVYVSNLVLISTIAQVQLQDSDTPVMPVEMLAILAAGLFLSAACFLRSRPDFSDHLGS